MNHALPQQRRRPRVRMLMLALAWLASVAGLGSWMSQRIVAAELDDLAVSAEYEARTTARIMDRLFTEMVSVTNMVARQGSVIQLAARYRTDPPGAADLTRQQRAQQFIRDPLVRKVGDFMDALASDLRYARIYQNNLSDDTVTASNWAAPDSIVGMIYAPPAHVILLLYIGLFFIGLAAVLILFKAFQFFFNGFTSLCYLFLYLCTLEILPILLLKKAVVMWIANV